MGSKNFSVIPNDLFIKSQAVMDFSAISNWARKKQDSLPALLMLSGAAGIFLGGVRNACWQVAVEGAQVLAGLVEYPLTNPFYIYQIKAWTLLHQLPALGLHAGLSEPALSIILSAVMGMLAFQALALSVYVFSRHAWISLMGALLIFFTGAYNYGVNYPIFIMGSPATYGAIGFSFLFVAMALLGSGRIRTGAVMLGLSPAIHASLGVLGILTVLLAGLSEWKKNENLRKYFPVFFALGLALSAVSFAWQWPLMKQIPAADPEIARRFLEMFSQTWDAHRQTVAFSSPGVLINGAGLFLTFIWLRIFHDTSVSRSTNSSDISLAVIPDLIRDLVRLRSPSRACRGAELDSGFRRNDNSHTNLMNNALPPGASLMLRMYQTAAGLSLLAAFLSHQDLRSMPAWYLALMSPRWLNFGVFAFPGLLLGLWTLSRKNFAARSLLFFALLPLEGAIVFFFILFAAVGMIFERRHEWEWKTAIKKLPAVFRILFLCLGILLVWRGGMKALTQTGHIRENWACWRQDSFFKQVSEGKGLLLLGPEFYMHQMLTKRPVLIDPQALDAYAYAWEGIPEAARILKEVYGVDLFFPPQEAYATAALPPGISNELWAGRSREDWQKIRRDFHVTQILTTHDVELQLPKAGSNEAYDLYDIPKAAV